MNSMMLFAVAWLSLLGSNQNQENSPAPQSVNQFFLELIDRPHDPENMIPELKELPAAGIYGRFKPAGSKNAEKVILKVVNQRFLVQCRDEESDERQGFGGTEIWTYDQNQQEYQHFFVTDDEQILKSRVHLDTNNQLIEVQSLRAEQAGRPLLNITYQLDEQKRLLSTRVNHWKAGKELKWETAFDWRTSLPKNHNDDNGWIENNILLFIALIQLAWIIPTLLIVLLVKAHVRRQEERRTLSLTEVADELNLDFQAAGDSDLTAELSGFPLFNHGRAKKLKNLINADTQELRIGIFDYQFTFGHGKHQRTRRLTAAVVRSSDLDLPASHLRPKRAVLDTLGSLFGRQDINFKHHPRFSESFVLKSDNEELIREFFDQELLEFFANNPNISFELQPGAFLFFRQWKRVDAQTDLIRDFLGEGYAVLQALMERGTRP
jgi:hypothetical protein